MREATIRLFKALYVDKDIGTKKASETLLQETVKRGFIFSPEVVANYSENILMQLIPFIEKEYGLTAKKMNETFQTSWGKIATASRIQLVIEQIVHYFTTYGFEALGIYSEDSVYMPAKKFQIPNIKMEDVKLVVIKGYNRVELEKKVMTMFTSGVAFKEKTTKDLVTLGIYLNLGEEHIEQIKNKEIKCMFYDLFGIVPSDPVEFLRILIYKLTKSTLLIKNKATIDAIKTFVPHNVSIVNLFNLYDNKYGYKRLAEVFHRFKPLWLAFKANDSLRYPINKIRRLAKDYHKPYKAGFVDTITSRIKHGEVITVKQMNKALENLNIFRKIRLANALKYRLDEHESIMYRIRNGKAYATTFSFSKKESKALKKVYDIIVNSITNDMKPQLDGKTIYLPENVRYPLPTTEKAFVDNLPLNTSITVPEDLIFGIHWENLPDSRVDIDLSSIDVTGGKTGWDSAYRQRTEKTELLFSGDITDAPLPKGATELFYVRGKDPRNYIIMINLYSGQGTNDADEIPFKILIAKEKVQDGFNKKYMVNPNKIQLITKAGISPDVRNKTLGIISVDENGMSFIFNETGIGEQRITARSSDAIQHARQSIINMMKSTVTLNVILMGTNIKFVDNPEEADIDLSPENLEKDTFLKLMVKE